MSQETAAFPIVFVGHVDHGKSSLIGRLLHETDSLPTGKVDELQAASERRKVEFEWSFVLDSLQLERDQAITVDSTQIWFHTDARRYVIVDAPGHHEFLRNMVTGASAADAAILVVDAKNGVCEQTRRHAYLLHLIGVSQIIVAINKMDLVGNDQARFDEVKAETEAYLNGLGETALVTIPLSAKTGLNMTERSADTPWYSGPTLLEALDGRLSRALSSEGTLRLPVQDVYRRGDKRIIVGRVENGAAKVGDELTFWPTGRTATLTSVEGWSSPDTAAIRTGQSVGVTLDHEIFVERGHVAVAPESAPRLGNMLSVRLFWLSPDSLKAGENLTLKLATSRYDVTVDAVDAIIDISDQTRQTYGEVKQNGIAEVTLRTRGQIVYDLFRDTPALGRGVLLKGHNVVGGCIIEGGDEVEVASQNLTAVPQSVEQQERFSRNGYRGGVLWMTGLSGAGKSTLAMALQRNLFEQGIQVYTLDGDNVRAGLNRDLGFSEADRTENLRRIAEVAKLFADSGTVVIAAFIAPTNAARAEAREICGDLFHEVYVKASLETCEGRDVKGLYAKARAGEIDDFTGISAPWEEPEQPDVVIQTDAQSPTESLSQLQAYVSDNLLGRGSRAI